MKARISPNTLRRLAWLWLLLALGWPAGASAHAILIESSLADGAILDAPPADVTFRFSEAIEPAFSAITLYDESSVGIGLEQPGFPAADAIMVALPPILRPGTYTVAYRVVSAVDGHLSFGSITFSVGTGIAPGQLSPPVTIPTGPTFDHVTTRWLQLMAALGAAGGLSWLFGLVLPSLRIHPIESGARLIYRTAWWVQVALMGCVVGTLAEFATRAEEAGGRPDAIMSMSILVPLLRSQWGTLSVIRLLGLLLAMPLVFVALRKVALGKVAVGLLLLLLLTFSASGHAAALPQPLIPIITDWVHQIAVAAWLGGLLGLSYTAWQIRRLATQERQPLLATLVTRFSGLALISVAVIIATGTLRSIAHLTAWSDIWQTAYGQTLSLKVTVLAVALMLGAFHWRLVGPQLRSSPEDSLILGHFSRSVLLETGLAVGVMLLASALVQTPHPVNAAALRASSMTSLTPTVVTVAPASLTQTSGGLTISLALDDQRPGQRTFTVTVRNNAGLVEASRVRLKLQALDIELGQQALILERQADGVYAGTSSAISVLGRWLIEVQVRRAGLEDVATEFHVEMTR